MPPSSDHELRAHFTAESGTAEGIAGATDKRAEEGGIETAQGTASMPCEVAAKVGGSPRVAGGMVNEVEEIRHGT